MDNRTVEEEDARRTAEEVGLAAIKYGDLSNQASKDYIFDVDRFTSFEGNTGPYILYTIVRIKSILKKYAENGGVLDGTIRPAENDAEKSLMLQVVKFNEVIDNVYKETAPHKLCAYIYDLANDFNKFYHETKILAEEDEEKKKGYLALLTLAKKVLETCIDLLGFTAPEPIRYEPVPQSQSYCDNPVLPALLWMDKTLRLSDSSTLHDLLQVQSPAVLLLISLHQNPSYNLLFQDEIRHC